MYDEWGRAESIYDLTWSYKVNDNPPPPQKKNS